MRFADVRIDLSALSSTGQHLACHTHPLIAATSAVAADGNVRSADAPPQMLGAEIHILWSRSRHRACGYCG